MENSAGCVVVASDTSAHIDTLEIATPVTAAPVAGSSASNTICAPYGSAENCGMDAVNGEAIATHHMRAGSETIPSPTRREDVYVVPVRIPGVRGPGIGPSRSVHPLPTSASGLSPHSGQ